MTEQQIIEVLERFSDPVYNEKHKKLIYKYTKKELKIIASKLLVLQGEEKEQGASFDEPGCFNPDSQEKEIGWISINDRLPESGNCVLLFSEDGGVAEGMYHEEDCSFTQFRWSVLNLENVTHWMPLPTSPKTNQLWD